MLNYATFDLKQDSKQIENQPFLFNVYAEERMVEPNWNTDSN